MRLSSHHPQVHAYVCTHESTYTRTHTCTCSHESIHRNTKTLSCTHAHIHMSALTHVRRHADANVRMCVKRAHPCTRIFHTPIDGLPCPSSNTAPPGDSFSAACMHIFAKNAHDSDGLLQVPCFSPLHRLDLQSRLHACTHLFWMPALLRDRSFTIVLNFFDFAVCISVLRVYSCT